MVVTLDRRPLWKNPFQNAPSPLSLLDFQGEVNIFFTG